MATAVSKARMLDLVKARCAIYNQSFNPHNIRTGNKVLRQRLKGPALAAYYPPRITTHKELAKLFPEMDTYDEDEVEREESVTITKARGKGPPKKKKTAEESKKFTKKKPGPPKPPKPVA